MTTIHVQIDISAPLEKVWDYFTLPEHIMKWNHASDDWHSPSATNDLRVGGLFNYRMEARDGSMGFDFGGTYTEVVPHEKIAYKIGDGRTAVVRFSEANSTTTVTTDFEAESENSIEMQQGGWQAILDNFKQYVETS